MARQPQLEDGSPSRMQSAPINIAYGNQGEEQFWRDNYNRWNHNQQNQFDDDEEEDYEQNHHADGDEDQMMMMQNGFSGGVIEPPEEVERIGNMSSAEENDVQHQTERNNDTIRQQKIAEMNDDLFEQLLAENERKLRQLISYVENVHLVLK